jgi:hypothetical protein
MATFERDKDLKKPEKLKIKPRDQLSFLDNPYCFL